MVGSHERSLPIQYCLAESLEEHCTVNISVPMLAIVIVCNALKIACFLTTAFVLKFRPLATIGDAISSFLENPDVFASELGTVNASKVQELCSTGFENVSKVTQDRRELRRGSLSCQSVVAAKTRPQSSQAGEQKEPAELGSGIQHPQHLGERKGQKRWAYAVGPRRWSAFGLL